ncbi:MAG: TonB family protein [Methylococcaceae bacterium]
MEAFALYLFKSVVWLTGFALVYLLFLRNERYFVLNRIYLVTGIVASILFPFFTWHYTIVIPFTPSVEVSDLQITAVISEPEAFPTKTILLILYIAGSLYLLYRIIRQTITVIGVIRNAEILPYRSAKLIRTAKYPSSFSFFSFVFVNPSSPETETREIVNHEMEHVRQRHWIDLLLFELLCTLQWLNPMCWLYGRFIRQNHEFLADQYALQRTQNPAIYRAALINQLFGGEVISLANSFHYSINKKRFHMMKNTIHPPYRKLKLLVILPLIAGVFYAFAAPEYKYVQTEESSVQNDSITILETRTITGKVFKEDGSPLSGASVVISGKTIGTITDTNGNFILKVTDKSPIVVSYVGYESLKMDPDFKKEMVITLKPVKIGIDEVTVTGAYQDNSGQTSPGTTGKTANTGMNEVTVTGAYQGNSLPAPLGSSVQLQTNSPLKFGNADGSVAKPLIVVDGVISENQNVNNIAPETIESISVLKDASATAAYGDKGKNGVILITKKKGISTSQKSPIDVNIQQNANAQKNSNVYTIVEQMPEYPGGEMALRKFIAYNIKYPHSAVEKGIQGKEIVSFVVTKTGSVADAKIVSGVDPALDQEALRVVNSMQAWIPGKQGGKEVDVQYTLPINFALEGKPDVYTTVEQMPEYPGGEMALRKYLAYNIKYPLSAVEKGIQGKVIVSFVITSKGSVSDAKILRGVYPSLDQEALRVVNSMSAWIPGKQGGKEVDVQYTLPINFVLEKITEAKAGDNTEPYTVVEQMPEFPGGSEALKTYIATNVKYPDIALAGGVEGQVIVSFLVDKTGNISKANIKRGVETSLDKEALRVVNSMPKWNPGKQNGENVTVTLELPINFKLPDDYNSENYRRKEKLRPMSGTDNPPYTIVEQMPEYPGGIEALKKYIASNIKYPVIALENGIQGKVYVGFVVTKTGKVTNAKVLRGVDPIIDQEAVRVVESMPAWIPGKQNGENVIVDYTLPIEFAIPKDYKRTSGEKLRTSDNGSQAGKLVIVPNPTKSKATVTLEGSDSTNQLQVSIIDSYGKMVKQETKKGPSFTLSVSSLTPATYRVVVVDGNKQYQGSLVVNH